MHIIPSQVHRANQVRGPNGGPNSDGPNRPTDPTPPFGGPNRPVNSPNGQPPRGGRWMIWRWLLLIVVGLILWQIATIFFTGTGTSGGCTVTYGTFYQQLVAGKVKDVTIQSDQANGDFLQSIKCSDGTTNAKFQTTVPTDDQTLNAALNKQVTAQTPPLDYNIKSSSDGNFWLSILINVVPWLLFGGLIFLLMRRAGQGQQSVFNFGKSRAKLRMEDRPSTTFADVAGVDEAKYELQEVVEFLKTPEKFQRLGGKIPTRRVAGRPARNGQDAAGAGGGRRGGRAVLLDVWL